MNFKNYLDYFKTVMKHKIAVFKVCRTFGITWRGIVHDLSKFLPSEFVPYAKYFNTDKKFLSEDKKKQLEEKFEVAWLHHKGCNKHHHLFWINWSRDNQPYAMRIPLIYVYEMVADWVGAGMTYKDNWNESEPYEYYKDKLRNSKDFDYFEFCTKAVIDTMLVDIKKYGLEVVGNIVQCGGYEKFYENKTDGKGNELIGDWIYDYNRLVLEYYGGDNIENKQ